MSRKKKILGFIALSIAMFMGTLDSTIVNIAMTDITNDFHASLKDTSWISTIYVMGLAVFTITASKLADQFGRKKVMLIGLALFGISSTLCGLSHSLLFLIAMRLIQGIGASIITPIVTPMGIKIFGKEKIQLVGGAIGGVTALAAAGGPPLGGLILQYLNWQSIFFVNIPFAVLSIILVLFFIDESYDETISKNIDFAGILLMTASLFLLVFALLKGNDFGWTSFTVISMFIGSAVTLVLFIIVEAKIKAPMVELALFRESTFTFSTLSYLITGFGISSPILIFTYFLQNVLGYTPLNAAFIIMCTSLTIILSMPLGNMIASRMSSRPVNFLGILTLGAGAFILSRFNMTTPKPAMVGAMVICGIGLGFASQSIISSIKHLPAEKSGIGSGLVNAARQIGTCIGIALLVSMLDSNIATAKTELKTDADNFIDHSGIVSGIKDTMIQDINQNFTSENMSSAQQQQLKNKMTSDIRKALLTLSDTPKPADGTLAGLYDGISTLRDGVAKTEDGEKSLNKGLDTLNAGLGALHSGSSSLVSGLGNLSLGLSQALTGSQKLNKTGSQGLSALSDGIGQLNDGAQKILGQFSSGSQASPTLYDGVNGVADGAQNLSNGITEYVGLVNNTLFQIIKNDPASLQLLSGYRETLAKAQAAYAEADTAEKAQYVQQIEGLQNLVAIYAAGTDLSVTNVSQFEAKLAPPQSGNGKNVVAGGGEIVAGTERLSAASQQIRSQFSDEGAFKNGMRQLADGLFGLNANRGNLLAFQSGLQNLVQALTQLNDGSEKLFSGAQNLRNGAATAQNGSTPLLSASGQLADAGGKIHDGAQKLANGVGLAGQNDEIRSVLGKIQSDKNNKLVVAFGNVFMLASVILFALSFCGLFTDKKRISKEN